MFLLLWFITTCLPFVNKFYGPVLGQCWWNQYYMLYDFSGYPGYLVLGHYIRVHLKWDDFRRCLVGIPCLLAGSTFTVLSFWLQTRPGTPQALSELEYAWCFCIANCAVATFGAFLLFTTIKRPGRFYNIIKSISLNSYGLYLMHLLWLTLWSPLLTPLFPVAVAIPVTAIATYLSSYICTRCIAALPHSRWIIG